MRFFNDLSVFTKLASGFLLVLLLCVAVGAVSYGELGEIKRSTDDISGRWIPAMALSSDMVNAANEFRRAEFRHVMATDAPGKRQAEERMVKAKEALAGLDPRLEKLKLPGEFDALLREYRTAWQAFLPINAKVLQLSSDGKAAEATALVGQDSSRLYNAAIGALDKVSALAQERGAQADAKVGATVREGMRYTIVITAVIVLAGAALAVVLARVITGRLKKLQAMAQEVAGGNLDACTLTEHGKDEIGLLEKAIMEMVCHLKEQLSFSLGVLKGLSVPCSVFSPKDTTLFTNQLMVDLIERGGKPEDYYGMTSGHYIWGDPNKETISTVAMRERRSIKAEREFTTHKGNIRHAAISSSPFSDESGNLLGTLSVWVDITEIKNNEALIAGQNAAILDVAAKAEQVAEAVSSASEELSAQVEQSSRGADIQKDRAAETATAMEEMSATVTEVARGALTAASRADEAKQKARDGSQSVERVLGAVRGVRDQALSLKERMASLEGRAQNIGRIMNVISDIADQTNLLALNAAIEAARAGEAGRGFAVVADEVRKLAEKTMQATHEVEEAITGIQSEARENMRSVDQTADSIESVAGLAAESGRALETIVKLSDAASGEVHAIATASEQQSAASEEINRAMGDINRISAETSEAMVHSSKAVGDLSIQAAALQRLIQGMRGGEAGMALPA
jgi:methyl-accepting chemotaxis protein